MYKSTRVTLTDLEPQLASEVVVVLGKVGLALRQVDVTLKRKKSSVMFSCNVQEICVLASMAKSTASSYSPMME